MVSMSQRRFVAVLLGVCVLSAAIGSGIALLAQTGPAGPAGKRGAVGPRGPRGPEGVAAEEVAELEGEIEELRGEIAGGEEVEGRLKELEAEVSELGELSSELCSETNFFC
jgi:hypothetical protein